VASSAPRNDLKLLQLHHLYPNRDISADTSRKIAGHLWYLSEDLILLSLFDAEVDLLTKRAILKASEEKDGEKDPPKRAQVDMATVQQKTLIDFVSKSSRNLFAMLNLPDGFLTEDPASWNSRGLQRQLSRHWQSPMTTQNAVSPLFKMRPIQGALDLKNNCSMPSKLMNRTGQLSQMPKNQRFLGNNEF